MTTHIDIDGTMVPVETMSDNLLIWYFCIWESLVRLWVKKYNEGDLIHDASWYKENIEKFKKERNERKELVNNILLSRHGKNYKGIILESDMLP